MRTLVALDDPMWTSGGAYNVISELLTATIVASPKKSAKNLDLAFDLAINSLKNNRRPGSIAFIISIIDGKPDSDMKPTAFSLWSAMPNVYSLVVLITGSTSNDLRESVVPVSSICRGNNLVASCPEQHFI